MLDICPVFAQDGLYWVPLQAPSSYGAAVKPADKTTPRKEEAPTSSQDGGDGDLESDCDSDDESPVEAAAPTAVSAAGRRVAGGGGSGKSNGGDKLGEGSLEFSWDGVEGLAATHDLCAAGPAFGLALALGAEDPAVGR